MNAGCGCWLGLDSGGQGWMGSPTVRSLRLRTVATPVEMEKVPCGNGGEEVIAIGR